MRQPIVVYECLTWRVGLFAYLVLARQPFDDAIRLFRQAVVFSGRCRLWSIVALWVLQLPVPQITTHSLQVTGSSKAKFGFRQSWICSEIRDVSRPISSNINLHVTQHEAKKLTGGLRLPFCTCDL